MVITNRKNGSLIINKIYALGWLFLFSLFLNGCNATTKNNSGSFTACTLLHTCGPEKSEISKTYFSIPRDPSGLADGSVMGKKLLNILDLEKQGRFNIARIELSKIRQNQELNTDGYHSLTAALAIISLKEGRSDLFFRYARQLDKSLEEPIRVDSEYVEVITLYRAINNESLPVNAPARLKKFSEKTFKNRKG